MAYHNRIPKTFCTTREAAEMLGVSLRTAQLWTESGLLEAWRTEGGHRRISRESIERLLVVPSRRGKTKICKSYKPVTHTVKARQFSILVVADGDDLRQCYETSLSCWPMHPSVTVVPHGYAALIRVGMQQPDMVIVDLAQPDPGGLQKVQSIRSVPELAKTSIVMVTDSCLEDIEGQGGIPADIPVLPRPAPFEQLRGIAERVAFARL
ncbi:MAG: excisionase family DNA-binding protein [Rhodocyclaceae bacterium]|nr:excisionase family DNA-binding protein [Rhodocyclaceae bacterium]MDZ4213456.1 excisionase family DNA-binding protein [Rhodocyclaceae bacterium]